MIGNPKVKNLFTDASCILQRGITSWAGMLITGYESELRSGIVGVEVRDPNRAEIFAVRYALRSFIRGGLIAKGDTVIIHSDNDTACRFLQNPNAKPPKDKLFFDELQLIQRNAADHGLAICAMWIKAHQGHDALCWRSLINQRVDREARSLARAEAQRLGNGS